MTTPAVPPDDQPWRIGTSWGIHVYQGEKGSPGERPVATFHDPADAQRAVDAVNGVERLAQERVVDALLWAAWIVAHSPGIQHQAKAVSEIRARAGALTADDRPTT